MTEIVYGILPQDQIVPLGIYNPNDKRSLNEQFHISEASVKFIISDKHPSVVANSQQKHAEFAGFGNETCVRKKTKWDVKTILKIWVGNIETSPIYPHQIRFIFLGNISDTFAQSASDISYIGEFLMQLIILLNKTMDAKRDIHLYRSSGFERSEMRTMLKQNEITFNEPVSTVGASPSNRSILQYPKNPEAVIIFDIIVGKSARVLKVPLRFKDSYGFGFTKCYQDENEYILAPKSIITVYSKEELKVPNALGYKIYVIRGRLTKQMLYDPKSVANFWRMTDIKTTKTIKYNPKIIEPAFDVIAEIKDIVEHIKYDQATIDQLKPEIIKLEIQSDPNITIPQMIRMDPIFQNARWNKVIPVSKYSAAIKRFGFAPNTVILKKLWDQKTRIADNSEAKVYFSLYSPVMFTKTSEEFVKSLTNHPKQFYTPTFTNTKTVILPATDDVACAQLYEIILPPKTPYLYYEAQYSCIILCPLSCTKIAPDVYKAKIIPAFPKDHLKYLEVFI